MFDRKEYYKKYYREHKNDPEYIKKRKKAKEKYDKKNPDYYKNYERKKRREVLSHYGGNPPSCACCGETHYEFLCIDHINNDGAEHRRKMGVYGGKNIVYWLVRNNFPEGFQILCYNCNNAKGRWGRCPHKGEV